MQALMLAAGMGKRLGKFTKNNTKCMLEVAGVKLVDRAIAAVKAAGIARFVFVIGYAGDALQNYILQNYRDRGMEFVFIRNEIYDKTNNIYSLYLAKEEFAKDDTILLESDLIYEETLLKSMVESQEPNLVAVDKYKSWMDGTVVLIDKYEQITQFIGKSDFDFGSIDSYYKTVNIYKFSKEFIAKTYLPFLSAYITAYGENEYYETVLKAIAHLSKNHLKAYDLHGQIWYEIDDAQDLDIATALFLRGEPKLRHMQSKFGGYWRYDNLLDFCYLVNPYFPPQNMIDKMKDGYEELLRQYPSGMAIQSMNASRMFSVDPEYILAANGAAEFINHLRSVVHGRIGVCLPTFNEYVRCFPNREIVPLYTSLTDYQYDPVSILAHLEKVDTMVIINPDNPSGSLIPYPDLIDILAKARALNRQVIVDESFIDFAQKSQRYTFLDNRILERYKNLIVIKSISKSYGVPGLRLGVMASGDTEIIRKMRSELPVWNVNSFAEYFLQIISLYQGSFWSSCDKIAAERDFVSAELTRMGYRVYPSSANFILVRLPARLNSTQVAVTLLEKENILIKDLYRKDTFESPSYLRLAIRNRADNNRLVAALGVIVNEE